MYVSVYARCSLLYVRVSSSVYLWSRLAVFRYISLFICPSVFSVHYHFIFIRWIGYKLSIISWYIRDPLKRFLSFYSKTVKCIKALFLSFCFLIRHVAWKFNASNNDIKLPLRRKNISYSELDKNLLDIFEEGLRIYRLKHCNTNTEIYKERKKNQNKI